MDLTSTSSSTNLITSSSTDWGTRPSPSATNPSCTCMDPQMDVRWMYWCTLGRRWRSFCAETCSSNKFIVASTKMPRTSASLALHRLPPYTATEDQVAFKKSMNSVGICVDCSYGELKRSFTSIHFRRATKLRQAPIAHIYVFTELLNKCRVCIGYGG